MLGPNAAGVRARFDKLCSMHWLFSRLNRHTRPRVLTALILGCAIHLASGRSAMCSLDAFALIQPGHPADVLQAGLVLPGDYATRPDLSRPLSLLKFPSSITFDASSAAPWTRTGSDPQSLRYMSTSSTVHFRRNVGSSVVSGGACLESESATWREDGSVWTRAETSVNSQPLGLALSNGPYRAGISAGRAHLTGFADSSRLAGLGSTDEATTGRLDWGCPDYAGYDLEAARDCGKIDLGVGFGKGSGALRASTVIDLQEYSLNQDAEAQQLAFYAALRSGSSLSILQIGQNRSGSHGLVLMGNLEVGSAHGRTESAYGSWYLERVSGSRTHVFSLEYRDTSAGFSAAAGGFLFPGIFSSAYHTQNELDLKRASVRYGAEHRRGSTSVRYSLALSYGIADIRIFATRAGFLQPRRVLLDERLDNSGLWLLSPALGMGYRKGRFSADLGVFAELGYLTKRFQHLGRSKPAPPPPGPLPEKRGSRVLPGLAVGLTLRQEF